MSQRNTDLGSPRLRPRTRTAARLAPLLAALIAATFAAGSPALADLDNKGTEFLMGFLPNAIQGSIEIHLTADIATDVLVEYPANSPTFTQTVAVTPGNITTVALPAASQSWTPETPANNLVRATANSEFVAYMVNRYPQSSDAALALPVDVLNTEYIVVDYYALGGYPPEFVVFAGSGVTSVLITPSIDLTGHPAGTPFAVELGPREGYLVAGPNGASLTGTIITADRPIGLTNGDRCTNIPVGVSACDHVFEVAQPVQTWGAEIPVANLPLRELGSIYRVVASEDGTEVRLDGSLHATLDRGEFVDVPAEGALDGGHLFEASAPIFVAQFMTGLGFENTSGDPAMGNMIPSEQFLPAYTFSSVGGSQFAQHFLTVIADDRDLGTITLDGTAIVDLEISFTSIPGSGFSSAVIELAEGTHTTSSAHGHGITVEGFNSYDSYLYPGGALFVPINTTDDNPPLCDGSLDGDVFYGSADDDRPTEDTNGNGVLDEGEDLNGNGIIDVDTGIFALFMDDDTSNLELTANFAPGDPNVYFQVAQVVNNAPGSGTVIARDGAANTCTVPVSIEVYDPTPPECGGSLDGNVFFGSASDDGESDTGIFEISLDDDTSNLELTANFTPGDPNVSFEVAKVATGPPGSGTVIVRDGAANTCTVHVSIESFDENPPECDGSRDGNVFSGSASDNDDEFDTGIFEIFLDDDTSNLALTANFTPGDPNVSFEVAKVVNAPPGSGTVIVRDGDANTCTVHVSIESFDENPPECDDGSVVEDVFFGSAHDNDDEYDRGIFDLSLGEDAWNLVLSHAFEPGAPNVDFEVSLEYGATGFGDVIAEDGGGNTCTVHVDLGPPDETPPECDLFYVPGDFSFSGTASDGGTGIASIALDTGHQNLSDPSAEFSPGETFVPFEVGVQEENAPAYGTVRVTDGAGLSCIRVIDLPLAHPYVDRPGWHEDVALQQMDEGLYAYVAAGEAGVHVYDVSNLGEPPELVNTDVPLPGDCPRRTDRFPDYYADGLKIVQAEDLPFDSAVFDSDVAIFAAGACGIIATDISDPRDLQTLFVSDTPSWAEAIDVFIDMEQETVFVYVASFWGGLRIFGQTDPEGDPEAFGELGSWGVNDDAFGPAIDLRVEFRDGMILAHVLTDRGLWTVDVSDPANPVAIPVGSFPFDTEAEATESGEGMTIVGDRAFIALWRGGILVLDISDPTNPVEVQAIPTDLAIYSVTTDPGGTRLYATEGMFGVRTFWVNVTHLVERYPLQNDVADGGWAWSAAERNRVLYVTYGELSDPLTGGLQVLEFTEDIIACGLGFELVFLLPPLLWLRSRRVATRRA